MIKTISVVSILSVAFSVIILGLSLYQLWAVFDTQNAFADKNLESAKTKFQPVYNITIFFLVLALIQLSSELFLGYRSESSQSQNKDDVPRKISPIRRFMRRS